MDEYYASLQTFENLKDKVLELLNSHIANNGINVTGIEGRVKQENSLYKKLELKGSKYSSISDITDIVGCRVITLYLDEVDRIAALIESSFSVDWENSVDKRKLLRDNQFGYRSVHYICSIPETLYCDPEHPEINQMRFEIQITTALQHVWASIHHDTGYKSDVEVPKEYHRRLNRLCGLMEIADEEFRLIRDELDEYRDKIKSLIKDGRFDDIELNGDSFRDYLELNPFENLNRDIALINKSEIQSASQYDYLEALKYMGMNNLGDLEKMKNDCYESAFRLAKYQLAGKDIDIISESVGLKNLCLAYIITTGGGVKMIKVFFEIINGDKPYNQSMAERIMKQAREIGIAK